MGSTFVNGLFLQLLLTSAVLVPTLGSNGLTNSDKQNIENGIKLGREIATVLEKGTFAVVLAKVAANIGPYLGALGPALSIALSFIPTQSAELEFLKNLKKHLDIRFDKVDLRFDEIERKIDWSVVKINFGQIEQNIRVMSEELEDLLKVPKEGLNNRKILFANSYENNYDNSGTKLYHSVVYNQGTFQENIGQSVMRYTKNDRAETNAFLTGILRLIMDAVKIELTYLEIKGFKVNADHEKREWQEKIRILLNKFKEIDDSVTDAFKYQCQEETKAIVATNAELGNEDLSNLLYKELTRKYYWRDWMVLVYNPVKGWDNHCLAACGGGVWFRFYGYNIVIASVDQSRTALDLEYARQTLYAVNEYYKYRYTYNRINDARDISSSMDQIYGACSTVVIRHETEPNVWGHTWNPSKLQANFKTTRGVLVKKSRFTLIVFG